jgi:hypothetical protein
MENIPTESKQNLETSDSSNEKKTIMERITDFFGGWFFENIITHKIVRWVILVIFLALIGVSIAFAIQLEPAKEQVSFILLCALIPCVNFKIGLRNLYRVLDTIF